MRYHMRERAWSLTEAFVIRDDAGRPVFEVRGKFFHIGDDLVLFERYTGQELVHIKQHILSLLPRYEIYRDGQLWADVHEQFRFFGERFKVEGANGITFHVDGDIWQWNFTVSDDAGNLLAQIGRQFSLFRDSYAVDVAPNVDAPFILALAIVIEMVKEHHERDRH
ncbi:MAG TPA: LURP-one-related family protein [Ktedonobacteraceae bacterium]|nr:LURP-one-related family protein [Ktedonobacteraceae bacterium]